MEELNRELELFIRRQVTENTVWQRLTIIYDDHLSPGEAASKIMHWIRSEKCSHDCDPNIRYQCICVISETKRHRVIYTLNHML